jgi:hypothetical protein
VRNYALIGLVCLRPFRQSLSLIGNHLYNLQIYNPDQAVPPPLPPQTHCNA